MTAKPAQPSMLDRAIVAVGAFIDTVYPNANAHQVSPLPSRSMFDEIPKVAEELPKGHVSTSGGRMAVIRSRPIAPLNPQVLFLCSGL